MLWNTNLEQFHFNILLQVLLRWKTCNMPCHHALHGKLGTDMMCHIGFFNRNILDDMGGRIDELEQSINELRAEMGVEGSPPSVPSDPKPESKSADDSA